MVTIRSQANLETSRPVVASAGSSSGTGIYHLPVVLQGKLPYHLTTIFLEKSTTTTDQSKGLV
jgi:hypothetical protein